MSYAPPLVKGLVPFLVLFFATLAYAACPWETSPRPHGSFHEMGAHFLNYGVVCFGHPSPDCLTNICGGPLFSFDLIPDCEAVVHYIAVVDVLLLAGAIVGRVTGNYYPLAFVILATLFFFVL